MAKLSTFRARRRSAAEKRVLLPLQRQIGSIDRLSRRKYLQDFSEAYQSYERVITKDALLDFCTKADALLVSDFHALDTCQRFLCELLEQLSITQPRSVVLLLEAIFTRDQHIMDEWQAGTISDRELRQRLRFDADWGYAWEPFLETLKTARTLGMRIYGADCVPRGNMRRISQRDRHAADTVARVRRLHTDAMLVMMFGESHLAPNHLPREIKQALPNERLRIVLQNVDALYFRSAGEAHARIDALQVNAGTAAVFNSTPVEKWQSYRFWIARWRSESRKAPDFAPAVYDLIDALLDFLHISGYSEDDGRSRYFVDCYPEVASVPSLRSAQGLLARKLLGDTRRSALMAELVEHGSCYVPESNLLIVHQLRLQPAAKDVVRFVHHACRDFTERATSNYDLAEDAFYARAMEHAVVDFGARVLCPSHPANEEEDLVSLYAEPREEVEASTLLPYRDYLRVLDCVMLHRDYELNSRSYTAKPTLLEEFLSGPSAMRPLVAKYLGELLGSDLYRAYLAGRLSRSAARSLFFRKLHTGVAREIYFATVRRVRQRRTDLAA